MWSNSFRSAHKEPEHKLCNSKVCMLLHSILCPQLAAAVHDVVPPFFLHIASILCLHIAPPYRASPASVSAVETADDSGPAEPGPLLAPAADDELAASRTKHNRILCLGTHTPNRPLRYTCYTKGTLPVWGAIDRLTGHKRTKPTRAEHSPASVSAVETADDSGPAELGPLLAPAADDALAAWWAAAIADGATSRDVALSKVRALRY
jgi:hypothetical protein